MLYYQACWVRRKLDIYYLVSQNTLSIAEIADMLVFSWTLLWRIMVIFCPISCYFFLSEVVLEYRKNLRDSSANIQHLPTGQRTHHWFSVWGKKVSHMPIFCLESYVSDESRR